MGINTNKTTNSISQNTGEVIELYQSEIKRYYGLLENLNAGVVIHSADTSIILNNKRASELLGLSDEQMRGKLSIDPEWRFFLEDNTICPLDMYPVVQVTSTKKSISNQIFGINRPTTKDIVWVSVNGFPIFKEDGEISEIIINFIDVTARKNLEMKLQQSYNEILQRQFAIDQHAIVAITDSYGTITYANDIFCEISKYSRKELIGQDHRILNSGYHNAAFFKDLYSTIKQGKVWHGEIRNKAKDGSYYWVATTIVPLKDSGDNITNYVAIRTDITARISAEEELKEGQEKYKELYWNNPLMLFTLSEKAIILEVNNTVIEQLKYQKEELIGESVLKVFHPEEHERVMNQLQNFIKNPIKDTSLPWEFRKITKHEKVLWVSESVTLFMNKGSEPNLLITCEDITDRKWAEKILNTYMKELETMNQSKDKFFSILAHDLRNPFAGIIGITDLLISRMQEYEDNDENLSIYLKYLQMIQTSSKSAFTLLENLMQWAKSQTNSLSFIPQNLSIKNLIDSCILLVAGNAFIKNIVIEVNYTDAETVYADESIVNTIIRNVITNAIKFTYPNGKITVSTTVVDNFLEISITDTGVGISPENLDKVFRIDSKFSKLGTANEKGSGLGLVLCKEFVEKQGGKIWAESEIGKGSTFTFTLPLAR